MLAHQSYLLRYMLFQHIAAWQLPNRSTQSWVQIISGACRRSLEWVPIMKSRGILCIPCYISTENSLAVLQYQNQSIALSFGYRALWASCVQLGKQLRRPKRNDAKTILNAFCDFCMKQKPCTLLINSNREAIPELYILYLCTEFSISSQYKTQPFKGPNNHVYKWMSLAFNSILVNNIILLILLVCYWPAKFGISLCSCYRFLEIQPKGLERERIGLQ